MKVCASLLAMECRGLAATWDADEGIRARARELKDLFALPPGSKWLEPTRLNAIAHEDVLIPALLNLRENKQAKLPYLPDLQAELVTFYNNVLGSHDEKTVLRNSQELKRLIGLIKRRAVKGKKNPAELTKDNGEKATCFVFWS